MVPVIPRLHYNVKPCWHDYLQHGSLPVRSVKRNCTVPKPCYYNRAWTTSRSRASTVARLEKSCLRNPLLSHRYSKLPADVAQDFILSNPASWEGGGGGPWDFLFS